MKGTWGRLDGSKTEKYKLGREMMQINTHYYWTE